MKTVKKIKKIIGITGGVGTGKSTVSHLLKNLYGFSVINTDETGHEAFIIGSSTYDSIVSHFGDGITDDEGKIKNNALASIIFSDPVEKKYLDDIIHPFVFARIDELKAAWEAEGGDTPLVIETALMFETGCERYCDEIWGVVTDHEIRVDRLMRERGYPREKTESILANQISDEELKRRCDVIIKNDGDIDDIEDEIKKTLICRDLYTVRSVNSQ